MNFVLTPAGPGGAPMSKEDVEFRKVFQEGINALNANNYDEALTKFQGLATQRPDCFQCQLAVGEAFMGKKDYPNSEVAFNKAKEMKPDAPEPYRGLRNLYNDQKQFDKAAEMAAEANKRGGGTRRSRWRGQRRRPVQPGGNVLERRQVRRGADVAGAGAAGRSEPRRGALSVGHGGREPGASWPRRWRTSRSTSNWRPPARTPPRQRPWWTP